MKKKSSKKRKNKSSFSFSKLIIFILLSIIFMLSGFIGGYILSEKKTQKELKKYQNSLQTLQQKINTLSKELKKQNKQSENNNKSFTQSSEILDLLNAPKPKTILPPKNNFSNLKISSKKPKLVIIIDDVAFKYEINLIKKIPYHITPSFFPPTKRHPFTPNYAKEFTDYMIHVPMQAFHYAHPEADTMDVNWSYTQIKNRIDYLKKIFPRAKFINNHTGSKFTSNLEAMYKLFKALKKDHLGFVDSRTTALSKAAIADKTYKIPFFSRNIFLDDIENENYIKNQLKKAIDIAKKRGYAIAIGHPHKITLETLKNSKKLLNQVDVIYIDELAKYAKN